MFRDLSTSGPELFNQKVDETPHAWLQQAPRRIDRDDLDIVEDELRNHPSEATCPQVVGCKEVGKERNAHPGDRRVAMRAVVPHMPAGSAAVVVGSTASEMANPPYGTYAATKAALRSYVRTWTAELAPRGIRVNVLSPGPTETHMMAGVPDDVRKIILGRVPLGRFARPEEIAGAALFLVSDESAYMAGSDLQIDGGMAQV